MIHNSAILSICYGDYHIDKGGVFKMIYSHQLMMNEAGLDYIYVYPVVRIFKTDAFCWHLIINGRKMKEIYSTLGMISYLKNSYGVTNIFIHHLMNLKIEDVSAVLDAYDNIPVFYYIHDYYTLCNQYNLLRNGREYCGKYGKNSTCKGCDAYKSNDYDRDQIISFFHKHKTMNIIAPSDSAKEIWTRAFPFMKDQVKVIYHQKLWGRYNGNKERISNRRINIAYVGTCTRTKGWDDWRGLISSLSVACKEKYSLYSFGNAKEKIDGLQNIYVNTTNNPDAMVNTLREYKIDVVFLGSIWPETYSYTYYEAFAANAYIIANHVSGNIANQVAARNNGYLYTTLVEVLTLLEDYSSFSEMLSEFKKTGVCGPEKLEENRDILNYLSEKSSECLSKVTNHPEYFSFRTKIISHLDQVRLGRIALYRLGGR